MEYHLLERRDADDKPYYLLTVTDSGTYGLRGPALSQAELNQRGYELEGDENWAAFEGQGFTKKSDDSARGSRGQGKSAFLYHSLPPAAPGRRRMMMLYDSLLADGLYRLGVRNANPADTIQAPPWENGAAREIIRGHFTDSTGIDIDLSLEPLSEVGTRVIVPYLSDEAVTAIKNGELAQWLQRCWWRAIQTGDLEITVVDETTGRNEPISVPEWWENEPWVSAPPTGVDVRAFEDIEVWDGLRIKRIVLLYDEKLGSTDAEGDDAQFEGVQLLRGQQWIVTMGSRQQFSIDDIPRDRRPGFRGFVEFDQTLDKELRGDEVETPQHHRFIRRNRLVQAIYRSVEHAVEKFAAEIGWHERRPAPPRNQGPGITEDVLRWLSATGNEPSPSARWDCQLSLSLPDPKVARVDLGQSLENVRVHVQSSIPVPINVTVSLEARHSETDVIVPVGQAEPLSFMQGAAEWDAGAIQIARNARRPDQIELPANGKWTFTARVFQEGQMKARASRSIYLNEDPPEVDPHPLTASISVENRHRSVSGRERINYGERVAVQINARNNTPDLMPGTFRASVGGVEPMLVQDGRPFSLRGTPKGDAADRQAVWAGEIIFRPIDELPLPDDASATVIQVEPGRHRLNADLYPNDEDITGVAPSYQLLIEIDPTTDDGLPFRPQEVDEPISQWQFHVDQETGDLLVLFPSEYATLRKLSSLDEETGSSDGRDAFLLEITCEAYITWALEPAWQEGDCTRLDALHQGVPPGVDSMEWEGFLNSMDQLASAGGGELLFPEISRQFRGCSARLMRLYESSHRRN